MKLKTIKFISLILFIILAIFLFRNFGSDLTSPMQLREEIENYGNLAPIIFIFLYIVFTLFFFPGTILTISSGILFGTILGTIYTIIGATIGGTLAFFLSKFLGRGFVKDILEKKYEKLNDYDKKLEEKGFRIVAFLRLIPIFPFNGLNFGLGLSKVKTKDFILGTIVGIIPGSFTLAFFGDSITELNYTTIIISSILFILLIFSPKIYKYIKKRVRKWNGS